MSFVHLHNHTHYSLLDGACRIEDMVDMAIRFRMPALAITDHGNLFGAIHFYETCEEKGIKPLIGFEAYVAPRSRKDRTKGSEDVEREYHLILLAKDTTGYRNLMKLSSIGYLEGFYYKPRIDREVLEAHREGLVVLSGCIKGEIPRLLLQGNEAGAREAAQWYRDRFGDDYYLEIQDHGLAEEKKAIRRMLALGREIGIGLVATNDTHYLMRDHAESQDILLCLQTGKDRDDPKRMRFSTDQVYFKSPEEMGALFSEIPEAITNTLAIAEKCSLKLDFSTRHFPRFHLPESEKETSLDTYFERLVREGAQARYPEITPEIQSRLDDEIRMIREMGFQSYFLITADFIRFAKSQGIPVGPGRGSAAGSIVSYALGITDVDPLRYSLLFERFLNPERVSMPDIDIDFCYERRQEVIEYVKRRYGGETHVTQIITFGSMNARAVVRDVGRVLKIPYGEVDRLAKMIPSQLTLDEAYERSVEFRDAVASNPTYRQLLDNARVLEGLARHASTHAAGVVIAPGDLTDYVPLFGSSQGDVTTQYDMKSLEKVGLLKMDFLGLRTLTVIDHTVKALKGRGITIAIEEIPLDDPKTFELFSSGQTVGVFQFESSGMREYLRKLKPESIGDLTAMNALYRPGPMEWIDDFIARKRGRKKIIYLHPLLEPILKETYGIIVYQEQVMQIAARLAGFSLSKADLLRRAMGKKDPMLMEQQRQAFVEGAVRNRIPEDAANQIFDLINQFAGYGFNKSHATCYSIIAYQTAYLKAHYPYEFMAANLTSEMQDTDRIVVLIDECKRMGIPILPPDVNTSMADFVAEPEGIRFGLCAIKNVGMGAIQSIIEAREKHRPFRNLFEFCQYLNLRLVNKKVLESLIQVGALDSLEGSRAQKMAILDRAIAYAQGFQQESAFGQFSIFETEKESVSALPPLPEIEEWPEREKLKREKALLGFYISGHPLDRYRHEVEALADPPIEGLVEGANGRKVRLCGLVGSVQNRIDRKNNTYALFELEDFTGSVRCVTFSDTYQKFRDEITPDRLIVLIGKLDRKDEDGEVTVIASEVFPLSDALERLIHRLVIRLPEGIPSNGSLEELKALIQRHRGECTLEFLVPMGEQWTRWRSRSHRIKPDITLIEGLRRLFGTDAVRFET